MYTEAIPSKLKKARENTGLSQKDVELETNIEQSVLTRYENGKRKPTIENLGILADFYEISVDWLLGTKGGKKSENTQH